MNNKNKYEPTFADKVIIFIVMLLIFGGKSNAASLNYKACETCKPKIIKIGTKKQLLSYLDEIRQESTQRDDQLTDGSPSPDNCFEMWHCKDEFDEENQTCLKESWCVSR